MGTDMSGDEKTKTPQQDRAPVLHLGAGVGLFLGLGVARLFGLYDFDAGGNMALLLFPTLVFVGGQPRGRRAWVTAILGALLVILAVGGGILALRWMAGGRSGMELLTVLAGLAVAGLAMPAVRAQSGPGPEYSPTNPKAWKPITRWGVLAGLVLGLAVFVVGLRLSIQWTHGYPELEALGFLNAVPNALMMGIVAAMTAIWCRPPDRRAVMFSILAGLGTAALAGASLMGGASLVMALAPERGIFEAMKAAVLLSAALLVPVAYAVTWKLGRRPVGAHEIEGDAG